MRPYWGRVAVAFALGVTMLVITSFIPLVTKTIIDDGLTRRGPGALAGARARAADGAGRGPLGRRRAAAQHLRTGRDQRRVRPPQPAGPPPAGPRTRLPRPGADRPATGQDDLGRALAALLHLPGPGVHGPQRDHLRQRGGAEGAALAPPQPGRARPGPAAGLRGAAPQPPPAPRR